VSNNARRDFRRLQKARQERCKCDVTQQIVPESGKGGSEAAVTRKAWPPTADSFVRWNIGGDDDDDLEPRGQTTRGTSRPGTNATDNIQRTSWQTVPEKVFNAFQKPNCHHVLHRLLHC